MSSKRVIDSKNYVQVGDPGATLAGTFTFPTVEVLHLDNVSISAFWTGTCVGTLNFLESNDGIIFTQASETISVTTGTSGKYAGIVTKAKFVAIAYARTSGSGTVKIHLVAKSNS